MRLKFRVILAAMCCLMLWSFNLKAATLQGTVKDAQGKTLQSITLSLLLAKDSTLFKGDISDKQGIFRFENVPAGQYILHASGVGYEKYFSGVFTLSANEESLEKNIQLQEQNKSIREIRVLGKKPMIEVKADKTVFNVEQSINAAGTNALDLLRKSPGVRVDKDENIEMRGKNNVMIYIDGKPSYLDNKDLANMLRNMQSTDIESIELISNPSAKYDAEGNAGIINIKLKKNKKFGTNGSVNLGIAQGKYFKQTAGISLNNRNKKWNLFGNYSLNNGKNYNYQNLDRIQNANRYTMSSDNYNQDFTNAIKVGADYYANQRSVFGVMANVMYTTGEFVSRSRTYLGPEAGEYTKALTAANNILGQRINANWNANYKYEDTSGRSLNVDLDYGIFNSTAKSYQPNTYWDVDETQVLSQNIFRNNTPTQIHIYSGKIDYEQNLLKGKLGVGIKSALVKTDNDFRFYDVLSGLDTLNLQRSNHFIYTEWVNAAYVNYSGAIKKWSYQLGLRAEQTNSTGALSSATPQNDDTVRRQYLNFFPSGGITYQVNDKHALGITYSRRIDRPNYQDLNPFENKLDELTYEKGNAFLRPQYSTSLDLTHTFMQAVTSTLNYTRIQDMFQQTTDTTEFSRTYVMQKNFASMEMMSLNISFPVPVQKWWMIFANVNAGYNLLQANFEGRTLRNAYWTYTIYADNTITLPKEYSLNITGWYTGPNYWGGTFLMKPMGSLDVGIQKQLMQKKLSLKLSLSDLFKTQAWYANSNFSGLRVRANGNYESRQFRVNLSYRFGKSSVEKQRERSKGSENESKRIKG